MPHLDLWLLYTESLKSSYAAFSDAVEKVLLEALKTLATPEHKTALQEQIKSLQEISEELTKL